MLVHQEGFNPFTSNISVLRKILEDLKNSFDFSSIKTIYYYGAMVSKWVYEKGLEDNVIEKVVKDGKTYFVINDYEKLRELFGDLLREIQRIKSWSV